MGRERVLAAVAQGARLVAACDPDRGRARELAAPYPGCSVLDDATRLDWGALDAVFVCTPPFARGPVELAAIDAGVALFVEKPIGLSAAQAAPIVAALRRNPVPNAVGYMSRYRDSVARARRLLAGSTVLGVAGHWVGGAYRVPWWAQPEQSGGQVNEQCTHLVDLVRYLAGEIEEVHAFGRKAGDGTDVETAASISLRLSGGVLGSLFYGCLANRKQIGLRVFTPTGSVALEGWDMTLVEGADLEPGDAPRPEAESIFAREVAAFVGAIQDRDPTRIKSDLVDAARTQRAVDTIRLSMSTGRRERVPRQ
jgi:predicted dehydrogenase